jgi:CelD/BcsL family acetyltransferase involved in cellulose biosynthesis
VLRSEIVASADWPERLRGDWCELVGLDPTATPFQAWEWQSIWFSHFARSKKPHIWTLYEGNDLVGLMPLVEVRSPWRALRPMGVGPSDYLQPIAGPGYAEKVAGELSGHFVELSKTRMVDFHQLRETLPLAKTLSGMALNQATCLVLDLPASYDEYLKTLGRSLRYDVKRLEKPPFTEGKAKIVPVEPSQTKNAIDFFFEAHKKRWSKRGLPGAFLGGRIQDFHRDWAVIACERGWLWMSLLELEGQLVGAIYAMRFGKACYFYQSGFDPSKSSMSPGTLLVAHTIRRAIEEGLSSFDFMRGDEPYKRRWQPQHSYKNLRILLAGEGMMPRLGARWNRTAFKVEARIRERLEGKSLRK